MTKLFDQAGALFLTAQALILGAATAAFGLPL